MEVLYPVKKGCSMIQESRFLSLFDFQTNGERVKHEGYTTDIITDRAFEWLDKRDKGKPFFLMCQHKAPHGRWEPALRHLDAFEEIEIPEPYPRDAGFKMSQRYNEHCRTVSNAAADR